MAILLCRVLVYYLNRTKSSQLEVGTRRENVSSKCLFLRESAWGAHNKERQHYSKNKPSYKTCYDVFASMAVNIISNTTKILKSRNIKNIRKTNEQLSSATTLWPTYKWISVRIYNVYYTHYYYYIGFKLGNNCNTFVAKIKWNNIIMIFIIVFNVKIKAILSEKKMLFLGVNFFYFCKYVIW